MRRSTPSRLGFRGRRALSLFTLLAAFSLGACATNPVTGERELALVSESQEIQMGQEADQQIVASMGVVDDPELAAYVDGIGQEMAAISERPDLPWTFRVIDDPTVNAFALPGGFVYVTRGMLSHLESEAQLAGIMGHEIGHVTARHSVNQMSRAQLAQLGLGMGLILVPELRDFGQFAGTGLQLLFLKFGRDDEHQSDELGVRYMADFGYEPAQLARVFEMLERKSAESGGSLPSWASTHPAPRDRQENILAMDDTLPSADRVARRALLRQVDGLVFGVNPRQGFFADGIFHHPDLEFRFSVPGDWQGMNGAQAVQVVAPDQDAAVLLRLAEAASPSEAAQAFGSQDGVQVLDRGSQSINGLPAVWMDFVVDTGEGRLRGRAAFPELGSRVYTMYGFAAADRWSRHESTVTEVLGSFQRERDPEVLAAQPDHLDLVRLDRSLTVDEFVRAYPTPVDASTVVLINQVWSTERFDAGLAKWVTR